MFQQDGAPAHIAKKVHKVLASNFAEFWAADFWPPSLLDINPLDYFWWSAIEREVNATPHPNLNSLKAMISEIWDFYPADSILDTCRNFRHCVEAVIAAKGLYLED